MPQSKTSKTAKTRKSSSNGKAANGKASGNGRVAKTKLANPSDDLIRIRGARQHNLKDINLDLPRNQMIVFTGVSGSGKSSLAFDTIFAEGQRRYVESLSAYARQFLGQVDKPDVDSIEDRKSTRLNSSH